MNLTLHVTNRCNLRCAYCAGSREGGQMPTDVARAAVSLAAKSGKTVSIGFYGGEPLLRRELIFDTVEYAARAGQNAGAAIYYNLTTNGTLLDETFLRFARDARMVIALSHDGLMQDACRRDARGTGTFDLLEEKAGLLLSYQPYAPAMTTVSPDCVGLLADSVEWLRERGFRYLLTTPARGEKAAWDAQSMAELERQYKKMAKLYEKWTRAGRRFYMAVFEAKIASHLMGGRYCDEHCHLGKTHASVSAEGGLYPCIQFVDDQAYRMGDVWAGVDRQAQERLARLQTAPADCQTCAFSGRCIHTCGCMNKLSTGKINTPSPMQCTHERMLIPIADRLAERLYKGKSRTFVRKHYDENYALLSLIEDRLAAAQKIEKQG